MTPRPGSASLSRQGLVSRARAVGRSDCCASVSTRRTCRGRSLKLYGQRPGAGAGLVWNMARDHVAVAGVQNALVGTDPEFDRPLDHKTKLFVLMVVIGRLGVRLEVDQRHRYAFTVHCARGEPFSEVDRLKVAERRERFHSTTRSMIVAVPSPPPQHMVSRPYRRSRRSSSYSSLFIRIAPEAPNGCPTAMAPPFTFVLSISAPVSFCHASTTDANASLTSKRSMLFRSRPAFFRTGSVPTTACARMRARGFRPSCLALSSDIKRTAAAPSEIWLELPAVIECSGLKAGCRAAVAS